MLYRVAIVSAFDTCCVCQRFCQSLQVTGPSGVVPIVMPSLTETGLLKAWPADGPPLAWKVTGVGEGYSSVSIVNGKIYTLGDLEDGSYSDCLERS
jgi:hypothetical protein